MRKYEDEQRKDTIMFDGDLAYKLKEVRTSMDKEAEAICQELHRAVNAAETKFAALSQKYEPQFEQVISQTELSGTSAREVGFDFSNMEKYGVVFAKKIGNPIEAFLKMLRRGIEEGPNPSSDSIFVEPISTDFSERWDTRQKDLHTAGA